MKRLKATKRQPLANPRKSALRITRTVARNSSRRNGRPRDRGQVRPASHARAKARHKVISSLDPQKHRSNGHYQAAVKNFESAVRALQKQNYGTAREMFEKLVHSEARDVAERARVHLRLCQQRAGRPPTAPKSADELYTMGVACLNARNLLVAVEHLNKADKLKPNQDHIRYALAAAHALQDNKDAALEHLQAAVALRPENRFHTRRDEDFQGLAADPRFRRLIYPAGL